MVYLWRSVSGSSLNSHPSSAAAAAKSRQSCPTLCDPINGSPPGSPVPGILQARTLEWVAISFSSAWKWKVKVKSLSRVWLLATPWTVAYLAPPSVGFSRRKYWSGVPLPSLPSSATCYLSVTLSKWLYLSDLWNEGSNTIISDGLLWGLKMVIYIKDLASCTECILCMLDLSSFSSYWCILPSLFLKSFCSYDSNTWKREVS